MTKCGDLDGLTYTVKEKTMKGLIRKYEYYKYFTKGFQNRKRFRRNGSGVEVSRFIFSWNQRIK